MIIFKFASKWALFLSLSLLLVAASLESAVYYDYGDAPEPVYPTTYSNEGPRHKITGPFLGFCVDSESNGIKSILADGDDNNFSAHSYGSCTKPGSDEDGIRFITAPAPGGTATLQVRAFEGCTLSAWIDFNQDGDWDDTGENLFPGGEVVSHGLNSLTVNIPAGTLLGDTFGRFRCTTDGAVSYTGSASDGEVEDHVITIITPVDYGDAPDPDYPVLEASTGAGHLLGSDVYLGSCADNDTGLLQSATALADDTNRENIWLYGECSIEGDDEDGVYFTSLLMPGAAAQVTVTANSACTLSAWIDFNQDGDWLDADESLFPAGQALTAGANNLSISVPAGAVSGATYSRFRCSTDGALSPTGLASDGEVEDHIVIVGQAYDYGDAPDPAYPTLEANTGARHALGSAVYLGSCVDAEPDGMQSAFSSDDDKTVTPLLFGSCTDGASDEDGVLFSSLLVPGGPASAGITASASCILNAWIDFNQNGDWSDTGEQIATDISLTAGTNTLNFTVPAAAAAGAAFSRFRCSTDAALSFTGTASDGEVEDYRVIIGTDFDFGDAPSPKYQTLLADNGPRHLLASDVYIGYCADTETDGLPNAKADGDDISLTTPTSGTCVSPIGYNDESGSHFLLLLVPGKEGYLDIRKGYTSSDCTASAWIDFNQDGDFKDNGEDVLPGGYLVTQSGWERLYFPVPTDAVSGESIARVRCSTEGVLEPYGAASDGEVEDHLVEVRYEYDYGDAYSGSFNYYSTTYNHNGARHRLGSDIFLGSCVDGEPDGQIDYSGYGSDDQNYFSDSVYGHFDSHTNYGDCLNEGWDDEDGVEFHKPLYRAMPSSVKVWANEPCNLFAWIDFNIDGDWQGPGEKIFSGITLQKGLNELTFQVPDFVSHGETFSRFRCSTDNSLDFDGAASDGEVEDHIVYVMDKLDYGDAPNGPCGLDMDCNYPVYKSDNGARHIVSRDVHLGNCVDMEDDGMPYGFIAFASDDDESNGDTYPDINCSDDEDGVTLWTLTRGLMASVEFSASQKGCTVYGWIDFNRDGDWDDSGEDVIPGGYYLHDRSEYAYVNFPIPLDAQTGITYARFRCTNYGPVSYDGLALDGEVEDYEVNIQPSYDYGDFPYSYVQAMPAFFPHQNAKHALGSEVYLGKCVDNDHSTRNSDNSDWDDLHEGTITYGTCDEPGSDEDGIVIYPIIAGGSAVLEVTANASCYLSGWIDFNRDNDWDDTGEHIFPNGYWLSPGKNILSYAVPAGASAGDTHARFRCTSFRPYPAYEFKYWGYAIDGEVEDYKATIEPYKEVDIALTKTASVNSVVAGAGAGLNEVTFTVTAENPGTSAVEGIVINENMTLPPGTSVVSVTPLEGTFANTAAPDGNWLIDTLAPGAFAVLEISVRADAHAQAGPDNIQNTAALIAAAGVDTNTANNSATLTVTTIREVDIEITKSESADPVAPGQSLVYTVTAKNNGPSDSELVVISEDMTLPSGVAVSSVTPSSGTFSNSVAPDGNWAINSLPARQSATLQIKLNAGQSTTAGTDVITNNAAIASLDETDTNSLNDSATVSTSVVRRSELVITKAESIDPVVAGSGPGNLVYTVTITNNGPSDASGVEVSESMTIPQNVNIDSITPSAGTSYSPQGSSAGTWNVGSLASGASATLTAVLTANQSAGEGVDVISNTAAITSGAKDDPDTTDNTATLSTSIKRVADIEITKLGPSEPPVAGKDTFIWTVEANNKGPSNASGLVIEEDMTLVPGLNILSVTPSHGSFADTSAPDGNWSIGPLAKNATATLTIEAEVTSITEPGTITNTARVISLNEEDPDGCGASNCDDYAHTSVAVKREVDIEVTVTRVTDTVLAGGVYNTHLFTVSAKNNGPSDASGLVITNTLGLPPETTVVSSTPSAGTHTPGPGETQWAVGTIAAGSTETLKLYFIVDSAAPHNSEISLQAITGGLNEPDTETTNDSSTETIAVERSVNLELTSSESIDPVTAGTPLAYTVTLTSFGLSDASGIEVAVALGLPPGVSVAAIIPAPSTTYTPSTPQSGIWNINGLEGGAEINITFNLYISPDAQDGVDTISIQSSLSAVNEPEVNPANNAASEQTSIITRADLSLTKTDSADPVFQDDSLTYTLTVLNNGPSDARGVTVTDDLLANVTLISTTGCAEDPAGVPTCTLGTLSSGSSSQYTINVSIEENGRYGLLNNASVSAATADHNPLNNSATEPTTVLSELMARKSFYISPENWLVRAYTKIDGTLKLFLEVADTSGSIVPALLIQGLAENPHEISGGLGFSDISLVFDYSQRTAYIRYLEPGGTRVQAVSGIKAEGCAVPDTYYADTDADGFGDPLAGVQACSIPPAYTADNTDCDDTDETIHPGAAETCDGIDNDCDTLTDDGADEGWLNGPTTCGDGVCAATGIWDCIGGVKTDTCAIEAQTGDDSDCDNQDDDCDTEVDEHYTQAPTVCGTGQCGNSGLRVCTTGSVVDTCTPLAAPEAQELSCSDNKDNDCDGLVDTADPDCQPPLADGQMARKSIHISGYGWLVNVYTEGLGQAYSVYIIVKDTRGNIVPVDGITAFAEPGHICRDNPCTIGTNALEPETSLVYDYLNGTAYVYHDMGGQPAITSVPIVAQ